MRGVARGILPLLDPHRPRNSTSSETPPPSSRDPYPSSSRDPYSYSGRDSPSGRRPPPPHPPAPLWEGERGKGQGVPAREGVPARGFLRLWAVLAWDPSRVGILNSKLCKPSFPNRGWKFLTKQWLNWGKKRSKWGKTEVRRGSGIRRLEPPLETTINIPDPELRRFSDNGPLRSENSPWRRKTAHKQQWCCSVSRLLDGLFLGTPVMVEKWPVRKGPSRETYDPNSLDLTYWDWPQSNYIPRWHSYVNSSFAGNIFICNGRGLFT